MTCRVGVALLAFVFFVPVVTARAEDSKDNYTIDISHSSRAVKVGEKGVISIVITPGKGKKVHEQAPMVASLKTPAGLTLTKNKLGHSDVVNPGAPAPELKTEFSAQQPGEKSVEAELTFFICTDKWCERQQQKVTVPVTVR